MARARKSSGNPWADLRTRVCEQCGKQTYAVRKDAKKAIRMIDPVMHVYAGCLGGWHVGHGRRR